MSTPSLTPANLQFELTIILGAVVGTLLRSGMPAGEIREQVNVALQAAAAIAARPEVIQPLSDSLITSVMDALSDEP